MDLVFLEMCQENELIHLKTSPAYHACQMKLLREEILVKKLKVRILEKDFVILKRKLRETLGIIDYTHICCLFLNKIDRKLEH